MAFGRLDALTHIIYRHSLWSHIDRSVKRETPATKKVKCHGNLGLPLCSRLCLAAGFGCEAHPWLPRDVRVPFLARSFPSPFGHGGGHLASRPRSCLHSGAVGLLLLAVGRHTVHVDQHQNVLQPRGLARPAPPRPGHLLRVF